MIRRNAAPLTEMGFECTVPHFPFPHFPFQGLVLGGNLLFSTDKAYSTFLGGVRKSLGHNIDFANQKDREAIGNALVQHIRNGGCDVTRDKVTCH